MRSLSLARRTAAALVAIAAAWPAVASEPWDRRFWDPLDSVAGQIELPLPCAGRMVFVRVDTPVDPGNPLSDREVRLGGAHPETGYLDYFRSTHLRGAFSDGEQVFYYLAKYETTRDQWAAVMGECPTPSLGGARPQGGVSWFDAVAFTRRLTEWLRAEAPEALPSEQGAPGYLRLPTEAEWEYAARGGATVDAADFRAPLPPMDGPLGDYAWFSGTRSAGGSYRPIGMKKPNPLGLDGMLGGVEELTLEPFQLNNLGRQHGQIGGIVTRGGSIETPEAELRSSLRTEYPFFSVTDGRATAFESLGLRTTISVPVNVSLARTTLIRDLWLEGASAETTLQADPLALLDELIADTTEQHLHDELAFVRGEIVTDRRAREEAAAAALRLTILNGSVLMRWLKAAAEDIARREEVIGQYQDLLQAASDDAMRERYDRTLRLQQTRLDQARSDFELSSSIYLDTLIQLDEAHEQDAVNQQASLLVIELAERGQDDMAPVVRAFADNVHRRSEHPASSRDELLSDALR